MRKTLPVIVVTNNPPGEPEADCVYVAPLSSVLGQRSSGYRVEQDAEDTTRLREWLVAEVESRGSAA